MNKEITVIASPMYFISEATMQSYSEAVSEGGEVIFAVLDSGTPLFPIERRVEWLSHVVGTRRAHILPLDFIEETDDFEKLLDLNIDRFLEEHVEDLGDVETYTLIFEKTNFEIDFKAVTDSVAVLETYKTVELTDVDSVMEVASPKWTYWFSSEFERLVHPKKRFEQRPVAGLFPIIKYNKNEFLLVKQNIATQEASILTMLDTSGGVYGPAFLQTLGIVHNPDTSFIRFMNDDKTATSVYLTDVDGTGNEVIKSLLLGDITLFDEDHELSLIPMAFVPTLTKEIAYVYNLYQDAKSAEQNPVDLDKMFEEAAKLAH